MTSMSLKTVKIVNHKAKNGFVIINLSDFVIGVHTLWNPEKNKEKIVVKAELAKTPEKLTAELADPELVMEPQKQENVFAETDLADTQTPSLESKSLSASPSIESDDVIDDDFEENTPAKRPYKRRGRKPGKK